MRSLWPAVWTFSACTLVWRLLYCCFARASGTSSLTEQCAVLCNSGLVITVLEDIRTGPKKLVFVLPVVRESLSIMESMSDLASALTERTAEADSILALPPVVVSHVLAFCDWREFDTLGQLNRCGKSKCSSTDIPGQSYSKFCVCVCVCVFKALASELKQLTTYSYLLLSAVAITGLGKLSCNWNTTTKTE
eukprot:12018-Heterococcus_DN1.PRE.2